MSTFGEFEFIFEIGKKGPKDQMSQYWLKVLKGANSHNYNRWYICTRSSPSKLGVVRVFAFFNMVNNAYNNHSAKSICIYVTEPQTLLQTIQNTLIF